MAMIRSRSSAMVRDPSGDRWWPTGSAPREPRGAVPGFRVRTAAASSLGEVRRDPITEQEERHGGADHGPPQHPGHVGPAVEPGVLASPGSASGASTPPCHAGHDAALLTGLTGAQDVYLPVDVFRDENGVR